MSNITIYLTTNQYDDDLYASILEEILALPSVEEIGDIGDKEGISLTGPVDVLIQAMKICQRKGIVE